MYFCPKCNFTLDISKTIINPNINEIKNAEDFIELVLDNLLEGINKIKFNKSEMLKNKKFKKLSKEEQDQINSKLDELTNSQNINAFFVCNNCNYHNKLESGTKIFTAYLKEQIEDDSSLLKLRPNDKTLPRTKDFKCINTSCKSNKKENEKTREAIFYRPFENEYKLKYVCCDCYATWAP